MIAVFFFYLSRTVVETLTHFGAVMEGQGNSSVAEPHILFPGFVCTYLLPSTGLGTNGTLGKDGGVKTERFIYEKAC